MCRNIEARQVVPPACEVRQQRRRARSGDVAALVGIEAGENSFGEAFLKSSHCSRGSAVEPGGAAPGPPAFFEGLQAGSHVEKSCNWDVMLRQKSSIS